MTIRKLIKNNYPNWINELNFPSHLLDMSIKESTDAYNKCMIMHKKYKKPFKLKHKTRKIKYETINLEKTMINAQTNSLFYNLQNKITNEFIFRNIKTSCRFDKYKNICDSSLTWNKSLNEYYLNVCFKQDIKSSDKTKINKICRDVDILVSKQYKKVNKNYKYNHEKRKNLKKAMHRKIKYLKNLRNELHNKSLKFLCDNYGKILMPPFETRKMVVQKQIPD